MNTRCCGRCDGINDICVADIVCEMHNLEGCEDCFGKRQNERSIENKAQMISQRFLSEVEKECHKRKISRKELAEMIGASRSYITQLFNGTKKVNMVVLAKFEAVLDITFQIQC